MSANRHKKCAELLQVIAQIDVDPESNDYIIGDNGITLHQIAGYPTGHSRIFRDEFFIHLYENKRQLLIDSIIKYAATGNTNQLFDLHKQYIRKRVTIK